MKNIIYILIIFLLLTVLPIVPHEREVQHGTIVIEQETIAEYLYNRYQQIQEINQNVDRGERPPD